MPVQPSQQGAENLPLSPSLTSGFSALQLPAARRRVSASEHRIERGAMVTALGLGTMTLWPQVCMGSAGMGQSPSPLRPCV